MRAFISDSSMRPAAIIAAGARPVDRYTIVKRAIMERQRIGADLATREAIGILSHVEPILPSFSSADRLYRGPLADATQEAREALADALWVFGATSTVELIGG